MSYHSDLTNNYQIFIINWLFVLNCKHNKSTNHDNNIIISIPVTVTVPLLLNIQQRWTDLHQDVMVMIFENIWFSKSPEGNDFNAQSKGKSKLENFPNSSLFPRNFSPEILNILPGRLWEWEQPGAADVYPAQHPLCGGDWPVEGGLPLGQVPGECWGRREALEQTLRPRHLILRLLGPAAAASDWQRHPEIWRERHSGNCW